MELFSRRCLQRLLEENSAFLPTEQTAEHVNRLNKVREDYLATEWEIAILNSLSKLGKVKHEPNEFGGNRLLDVAFESPAIQFGADITAVSDKPLHERNPVDRIWLEVEKEVRKRKITSGGFDIHVGSSFNTNHGRGTRHDLRLPRSGELRQVVFTSEFKKFMHAVATDPSNKRVFQVRNLKADVAISYDPRATTWSGSHLVYTGANVVDDNPVFHSLKRKAPQLKKSRYPGMRGIIMCDGGCEMLGKHSNLWAEFSLADVVNKVTRNNRSIGFVAVIALVHDRSGRSGRGHYSPALSVWVSPDWAAEQDALVSVLEGMVRGLPTFEASAGNALSRVMSGRPNLGSYFGGYEMGGDQYIKISAIGMLQLLAGTIRYDEFAEMHASGIGIDSQIPLRTRCALAVSSVAVRSRVAVKRTTIGSSSNSENPIRPSHPLSRNRLKANRPSQQRVAPLIGVLCK